MDIPQNELDALVDAPLWGGTVVIIVLIVIAFWKWWQREEKYKDEKIAAALEADERVRRALRRAARRAKAQGSKDKPG